MLEGILFLFLSGKEVGRKNFSNYWQKLLRRFTVTCLRRS